MTRACALVILVVSCYGPILTSASAQDLFELEVFPYDTTPTGDYDVEFHVNAMSAGTTRAWPSIADHRPVHLSVEVARGWTDIFETAVFIQTAPFASSGGARIAGGHLRSKVSLGELRDTPLRVGVSAGVHFQPRRIRPRAADASRSDRLSTTVRDGSPWLQTRASNGSRAAWTTRSRAYLRSVGARSLAAARRAWRLQPSITRLRRRRFTCSLKLTPTVSYSRRSISMSVRDGSSASVRVTASPAASPGS